MKLDPLGEEQRKDLPRQTLIMSADGQRTEKTYWGL